MPKKHRYIVVSASGKALYRGDSHFFACALLLINRNASAYGCGVWIVEPAYWISIA